MKEENQDQQLDTQSVNVQVNIAPTSPFTEDEKTYIIT